MKSDDFRRAHESARRACSRMQIQFNAVMRDGVAGSWRGRETGSSVDFQDHRSYYPGDDPRHIDWRVYARTEQHVMKLFREEITPRIDIVLDLSASMMLGGAKAQRSLELLYFALESGLFVQASVRCYILGGSRIIPLEISQLLEYSIRLPEPEPQLSVELLFHELQLRHSGLRILISDLLFGESPQDILRQLVGPNSQVMLFVPYSHAEVSPDWGGNMELVDCESGASSELAVDEALRLRYGAAYRSHFELWRSACRQFHVPYVRVEAEGELIAALQRESLQAGAVQIWA